MGIPHLDFFSTQKVDGDCLSFEISMSGCGDHSTSIELTMNSKMLQSLGLELIKLADKYKEIEDKNNGK